MGDAELLNEYIEDRSPSNFRALVERHLPLVYSAALRQVGDPVLAEHVVHAVFILLARRSKQLSSRTILPEWLFRTTRRVVAKGLPANQCRDVREQRARGFKKMCPNDAWEQMVPYFDEALARLGERDRSAVLLYYFQAVRMGQVGTALGVSEETAQKILTQATDKLHRLLMMRGADLPPALLPGLLMTRGAQVAPSYLEPSVTAAARSELAVPAPVQGVLQRAGREPVARKAGKVLWKAAALALIAWLAVWLWPHRSRAGASAYTFDSRIIARPTHVSPVTSPTTPALEELQPPVSRTNNPAPPRQVPLRSVETNGMWAFTGTGTGIGTLVPQPPDSSNTDASASSEVPVSSSPSPLGYSPAQNSFQVTARLGPVYRTNRGSWVTPPRSSVIVPKQIAPPSTRSKR